MSLRDDLPLPPRDAEIHRTVCQYCNVGCNYIAYTWPVGTWGGPLPAENAFEVDFSRPQPPLVGLSYTASMHSVIEKGGAPHHLALVPALDGHHNPHGGHSSRGATNARTTYSRRRGTRARLTTPLVRVGQKLKPISWDEAFALMASVIGGLLDAEGAEALAAKAYDHGGGGGGFENNFAIGRLLFDGLKMTRVGIHNRPAYNSEVWGSRDRGVHELHYTDADARLCDTLVLWGANSYETASVFFTEHMLPNFRGETAAEKRRAFAKGEPIEPTRVVIIDPRRTATVALLQHIDAERVLHLRPNLGTDMVLANAIARVMWEEGIADVDLMQAGDADTFHGYLRHTLKLQEDEGPFYAEAERVTGVPIADIKRAARWISAYKTKEHRRRPFALYEKGVIWNYRNYDTVAAVVQAMVLGGGISRPGTGVGRQGGHQEGYVRPPYPGEGRPPVNVDRLLEDNQSSLFWVIGTNPYLTTPRAHVFKEKIQGRTRALTEALGEDAPESMAAYGEAIVKALTARKATGLFMVVNELYLTATARDAHLVLPAAGWGEMNLTSISCNSRRLRLYERFMDPPGQAKPDWQIMAGVAHALKARYAEKPKMAARFDGFDWADDEAVFLAGGESFPDNTVDPNGVEGLPAECYKGVDYALLREKGSRGVPTPVFRRPESGKLAGTVRRCTRRFNTPNGLFHWHQTGPWEGYPPEIAKYLEGPLAKDHPFWLTTGRTQHLWQTGYHDRHIPHKAAVVPLPYVEIHPQDAKQLGISHGDLVELFNEEGRARFQARVVDAVKPGLIFALQYHPKGTANALTSSYTDPKTNIPWYKAARVGLTRVGPAPDGAAISALSSIDFA